MVREFISIRFITETIQILYAKVINWTTTLNQSVVN
jgi:hypothetical protein